MYVCSYERKKIYHFSKRQLKFEINNLHKYLRVFFKELDQCFICNSTCTCTSVTMKASFAICEARHDNCSVISPFGRLHTSSVALSCPRSLQKLHFPECGTIPHRVLSCCEQNCATWTLTAFVTFSFCYYVQ